MTLAYGYYNSGVDPLWGLMILAGILALFAQIKVSTTFGKYSKVASTTGLTGAQAAERILQSKGIYDVSIQHVAGNLTDHYDPANKVLRLSDATYNSRSVAAVGVAAHECGHAIQHDEGYSFLNFRTTLFPLAEFGSRFSYLFILAGLFFGSLSILVDVGIILFSLAVLFQVVTLPVEFDASRRAVKLLQSNGILYDSEVGATKKVLAAAAMTYVASTVVALLQLIRLIAMRDRNRD